MTKNLVAYFSASGVTANVAKNLAKAVDGDIYEIKPVIPYSNADLNWIDKKSRSSIEMNDKSSRPEIVEDNAHIENYDVIYLGFPIWWYREPSIIDTFLESYDFSNKTIVPFATSGSSGIGDTANNIKELAPNANVKEGKVIPAGVDIVKLKMWASGNML